MRCHVCAEVCVRPHALEPCAHEVCEFCFLESPLRCNVCAAEVTGSCVLPYKDHQSQSSNPQRYHGLDMRHRVKKIDSMSEEPVLVYFDLEATDKTPFSCRIVQVGAVMYVEDQEYTFNKRIKADQSMHPEAADITGISDADLVNEKSCAEVLRIFFQWLKAHCKEKPIVFVAHNGHDYDYPLLMCEMMRNELPPVTVFDEHKVVAFWDSLLWCRLNIPNHMLLMVEDPQTKVQRRSYKLGDLHQSLLGRSLEGAHDALADCRGMKDILECDYVKRKNPCFVEADSWVCMATEHAIQSMTLRRDNVLKEEKKKIEEKIQAKSKQVFLSFFASRPTPAMEDGAPKKRLKTQ